MKKIIFGSASAILAVVGFSAFKTAKTSATTYYWFSINEEGVPAGDDVSLSNSDASFIIKATTLPSADSPCNQGITSQCVVGFAATQVFTTALHSTKVLKTRGVVTGAPITQPSKTAPNSALYIKNSSL